MINIKTKQTKVAVNLVTYNAEKYLPFCLKSLADQTFKDYTVLIIDNGSTDRTVQFLRENYPQYKVVTHKNNLGFCKAHNQAIAWTKSKYVLCLNQDVILDKDYLKNSMAFMDKQKEASSLSGKIYKWDFHKNEKTIVIDSLGLEIYKNLRVTNRGENKKDNSQFNSQVEIFGVSGAIPIYRRQALDDIKIINRLGHDEYFDEDFFSYKEDVDIAYRLRLAGWQSYYIPSAVAWHDRSLSNSNLKTNWQIARAHRQKNKLINYLSYRNHWLTIYKNEFSQNILKYSLFIGWYELRKWIFMILFNHIKSSQFKTFWQLYPVMKAKRKQIKKLTSISAKDLSRWYL